MKLKKGKKINTDDFWYDLIDGGYIKPEELLADAADLKKVKEAIELLQHFHNVLETKNRLEYS